jgi:rare lipoprotein A (peptidoglycan hydrolase)
MFEGQKSTGADRFRRRWILVLAVVLPLAIAGVIFTLLSVTVQADVPLTADSSTPPTAVAPETITPPPVVRLEFANPVEEIRGIASWYGDAFDGHTTANGETYDMHALTACTNALPFESVVRVVNLRNHRSVVVRVNDRGLLFPGRVIDLSYAAAEKLDMMRSGVAPVRIDVLALGRKHSEK